MKRLIYILLILTNCIILYSQTYDSTHDAIWDYPSLNHSHLSYASSTYSIADSNKFLQVSTSGTITLATGTGGVTWGGISGTLVTQTDLNTELNKKLLYTDTTSLIANQWRVDLKQDIISNLADTSKYLETTDVKQGAYLSDTTKFSLTSHNHKLETLTGFPDTTGNTGKYLKVLAGGRFAWDSPSAGSIPAGVITMWSGSVGSIPSGWVLCDGTNGTPDLRDRFVIGAGGNYAVANTGGSNSYSLNYATSGTTTPITAGTPSGTIGWPANAPTSSTVSFTPTGTVPITSQGTVAWPVNVPAFTWSLGTLAITNHTSVATKQGSSAGNVVTTNTHTFTGASNSTIAWPANPPTHSGTSASFSGDAGIVSAATVTWPVNVPTFAGIPLATHSHAITGTQNVPTLPSYYALCYIMKQ